MEKKISIGLIPSGESADSQLTINEVVEGSGYSRSYINEAIKDGRLFSFKVTPGIKGEIAVPLSSCFSFFGKRFKYTPPPESLTKEEIAKRLNRSVSLIDKLIRKGYLAEPLTEKGFNDYLLEINNYSNGQDWWSEWNKGIQKI